MGGSQAQCFTTTNMRARIMGTPWIVPFTLQDGVYAPLAGYTNPPPMLLRESLYVNVSDTAFHAPWPLTCAARVAWLRLAKHVLASCKSLEAWISLSMAATSRILGRGTWLNTFR